MSVVIGTDNGNPGIVPPWIKSMSAEIAPAQAPGKNPGIVPPWLQKPKPKAETTFVPVLADLSPLSVSGYVRF